MGEVKAQDRQVEAYAEAYDKDKKVSLREMRRKLNSALWVGW